MNQKTIGVKLLFKVVFVYLEMKNFKLWYLDSSLRTQFGGLYMQLHGFE